MKTSLFSLVIALLLSCTVMAAPINTNFSDYPLAPTTIGQTDLDTDYANGWFYDNYGITFLNAYLYFDSRDTFDSIGIANDVGSTNSWIYFSDTTDFVTVDWVTISSQDIFLEVFDGTGGLLDSFFFDGSGTSSGTVTLSGTGIAAMSFHDGGGQVGISTLLYDYDGTTDGTNDDTTAPVPEPSTWVLMGTGLAGLAWYRRRKSA